MLLTVFWRVPPHWKWNKINPENTSRCGYQQVYCYWQECEFMGFDLTMTPVDVMKLSAQTIDIHRCYE
jgi:hypothetical protein